MSLVPVRLAHGPPTSFMGAWSYLGHLTHDIPVKVDDAGLPLKWCTDVYGLGCRLTSLVG